MSAFEYPLRRVAVGPSAMKHCPMASAGDRTNPEPIGVRVGGDLRHGVERLQVDRLHGAILHRGDTQRAHLPVALGDVDPPQRLWLIAPLPEVVDCLPSSLRGCSRVTWSTPGVRWPWFSVTRRTARTLALYEWVSRRCKALTLPHRPCLCRLHDTRLEPTHDAVGLVPVDAVPGLTARGKPHQQLLSVPRGVGTSAPSSALPPWSVCHALSCRKTRGKSARLRAGVLLPVGALPIRPITGRPSLAPSSSTRSAVRDPCGPRSPGGALRAYHVPRLYHDGDRLCLFAGGRLGCGRRGTTLQTLATYLLVQASQHLWLG